MARAVCLLSALNASVFVYVTATVNRTDMRKQAASTMEVGVKLQQFIPYTSVHPFFMSQLQAAHRSLISPSPLNKIRCVILEQTR